MSRVTTFTFVYTQYCFGANVISDYYWSTRDDVKRFLLITIVRWPVKEGWDLSASNLKFVTYRIVIAFRSGSSIFFSLSRELNLASRTYSNSIQTATKKIHLTEGLLHQFDEITTQDYNQQYKLNKCTCVPIFVALSYVHTCTCIIKSLPTHVSFILSLPFPSSSIIIITIFFCDFHRLREK